MSNIPSLYSESFMKFNVHLLLHLTEHVKMWGCLWAWSAFPYEHFNGTICKLFKGTQGVPEQICKNYQLEKSIKEMVLDITSTSNSIIDSQNSCAFKLFKKMSGYQHVANATQLYGSLTTFGKSTTDLSNSLSLQQKVCLGNKIGHMLPEYTINNFQSFQRFILNGMLIHTTGYQRLKKRHNSLVQLHNGDFVDITHLLQYQLNSSDTWKSIMLGIQLIPTSDANLILHSATVNVKESSRVVCFLPEELKSKCFGVSYDDNIYITPIVNIFERD